MFKVGDTVKILSCQCNNVDHIRKLVNNTGIIKRIEHEFQFTIYYIVNESIGGYGYFNEKEIENVK